MKKQKATAQKKTVTVPNQLSVLQKFKMETWSRAQITGAPYNPRQIDDRAKSKLRANIERVGLLQPIIVNRLTKRIVSGHQRVAIMDTLEGSQDYKLDVSVVELDEKTEKEQVVFLNNEFAMGTYDIPSLDSLMKEISFENAGFDEMDLKMMLPSWEPPQTKRATEQVQELQKVSQEIEETEAEQKHASHTMQQAEQSIEQHKQSQGVSAKNQHYIVLVFRDREGTDAFLDHIHLSRDEKYISGENILEMLQARLAALEQETPSKTLQTA